jgi:hypothetical protein
MVDPEVLMPPKEAPVPIDPSDRQKEGPFAFLANPVVDSAIVHIHPEDDSRREELAAALKLQFASPDPDSDYHYKLIMGLKLVGFDLNPDYEADPGNEELLVLADEKLFREGFFCNNVSFRFIREEDLVGYLLGFANQKIAEEADTFPQEFSADFSAWYAKLESAAGVDK